VPPPDEKERLDYDRARAHARAGREMLAPDDVFAPAYACLHARFALEALAMMSFVPLGPAVAAGHPCAKR
jgi:hypothetical protein